MYALFTIFSKVVLFLFQVLNLIKKKLKKIKKIKEKYFKILPIMLATQNSIKANTYVCSLT